jgi:hypothetical protein
MRSRCSWPLALVASLLLSALCASPVLAADANSCGYNQGPGGWYNAVDRSGPYTVDANCNANLLGGLVQASASAGGISTFSRIPSSAAGTNLTTAKSSGGRAYVFHGCNTTATTIYLRIYNAPSPATVTVGTTAVLAGPYVFPANACVQPTTLAAGIGIYAAAGITYAFGTAPSDADATGVPAGAIIGFQMGVQ